MNNISEYIHQFPIERIQIVSDFVNELAAYEGHHVFNPWRDVDFALDNSVAAPQQRRENLIAYLLPRLGQCHTVVVAEAVGYQGGRFTGIAITCERMLLGYHKQIPAHMISPVSLHRTSSDSSGLLKAIQQDKGFNEPTDTVVWGAIKEAGIDPYTVLLWNIFPFHSHKENEPLTNRTPTLEEQDSGWFYTKRLLALNESLSNHMHQSPLILGVGQKSADTMNRFGITIKALRHPANGGANLYRQGFIESLRG